MALLRIFGIVIFTILCFGWGFASASFKTFPWPYMQAMKHEIAEVAAFVRGNSNENTTVTEKLLNDFNIVPERFIWEYEPSNAANFHELPLDGIRSRRDRPRLWLSPTAPDSYRLIVGAQDFEKSFWGAILLDPSGQVIWRWYMNGEISSLSQEPDIRKNLYGVAFFPDGSAIFNMQENGGGLIKIDACSRLEWTKKGNFHHVVSPTENDTAFWTFGGMQSDLHPKLVLIDTATGSTIREIDMAKVERANPDIFIFDLQRNAVVMDATHPNDIEPLPTDLAKAYPDFAAGDLLISYNTTNLIFVLDPETLKIKSWFVGAGGGQHDPDWEADGSISLFNNNLRAERDGAPLVSSIVSVDPLKHSHHTVVDGAPLNFYSKFNGRHEITSYGTVIVTSSTQGRVFEIDLASGKPVFEFVNAYDWEDGRTLHLSETFTIGKKQAIRWTVSNCTAASAQNGR